MKGTDDDSAEALRAENAMLRARVSEIERRLARATAGLSSDETLGPALPEREALLAGAELIAHMGSWACDLRTGRVAWSDELFRILGYDPATDLATSDAYQARIHPEDLPEVLAASERIVRTRVTERVECRLLLPGGEIRYVTHDCALRFDASGELIGLVGTMLDTTQSRDDAEQLRKVAAERVHLEERLRQSQKMEALGQLAGGIAHDFNNLLTIILGGVDAVRLGRAPEEALGDIESAARSAAALTQRLLAFSRRAVVAPRVTDLRAVIEEVRPLIARSIGEHMRISFEYTGDPCTTRVDVSYAHQILLNLVVNARDAMPDGGTLSIRVERREIRDGAVPDLQDGQYVQVAVRDSGAGMDAATLDHVFEPFFTTKEVGKGTGLGLSLVYGAMKQCGGGVTVESEVGRGTTFRLYFPIVDEVPMGQRTAASGLPSVPSVLLVEDDHSVRRVVADTLRRIGARVVSVENGKEALVAWGRERFDLLLTDMVMPEMRGEVLAQELLRRDPRLRALFMTGYVDSAVDLSPFRHARVLNKPFSSEELARNIAELLAERDE